MNRTGNRSLRIQLLSVLCLIVWHGTLSRSVLAQRRIPASASPDTPAQRLLPLPQGGSAEPKQQVFWLQQLQGLLGSDAATNDSAKPGTSPIPKFDLEQLKALQELMKQFGGGRPEGVMPPAMDNISPEEVSKVLADPAMREQARRMLEQFSRDRKLPQGGDGDDSSRVPFPSSAAGNQSGSGGTSTDPDKAANVTDEVPATMPPALQEILQRLAEQVGQQRQENPLGNDSNARQSSAGGTESDETNSSRSTDRRMKSGDERTSGQSPPNRASTRDEHRPTTEPIRTEPPFAESRAPEGSGAKSLPRGDQATSKLDSGTSGLRNDADRGSNLPEREPPTSGIGTDRSSSPPKLNPKSAEVANRGAMIGDHAERPDDVGDRAAGRVDNQTAAGGLSSGGLSPHDRESRGSATPTAPPSNPPAAPSNGLDIASQPPIDVRSELEQRGFAETLRKIVDQARTESWTESNGTPGSSVTNPAPRNGPSAGLQESANRLLGGLSKSLAETAVDSTPQSTSPQTDSTPGPAATSREVAPSAMPQPSPERPSTLSKVREATGQFLTDITTAPQSRPVSSQPLSSSSSGSSRRSMDADGADARSTMGLLMLLGMLGLAWYFLPQLLAFVSPSLRAGLGIAGRIAPAEIRTRGDVVRAFHQFALQPAMPAPTWWTHREVQRQVATAAPALQSAVQTLADLYEQARYLPDDAEFTPEQIGTARQAFMQCEAVRSVTPRNG